MELSTLVNQLNKHRRFAIYGAQIVAYGVYTALRALYGLTPLCFVVSDAEGNPAEIEGIPVKALADCGLSKDTLVLVAVTELLQDEICSALERAGYCNYIRISDHVEHLLMSAYYDSLGLFPPLQGTGSGEMRDFAVYEAKNHRDRPLAKPPPLQAWEHPIQAGAGVTDMRIAPLLDNIGYNISAKNPMYAEMTAMYWVWKNTSHDWKGICHYRRHMVISGGQLAALASGGVDAIIPLPYLCYPDMQSHFRRYVSGRVKDALLSSLRALDGGRYGEYEEIFSGRYFYAYNMIAARREVFDGYCEWVFRVLEHMERAADTPSDIASTRALAYSAEALMTLYFLSNKDKLSISHVEKRIYV